MALLGNSLTIRIQSHSSGTANEVIAETTSVDAQFNAESLESTSQSDALNAVFEGGKNTIQVSGDYLLAVDAEQFNLLFVHANAGDKVEVQIYRSDTLVVDTEGVFTSLNTVGGLSDSLATGAYSMELDAVDVYGPALNVSNCVNLDYDTFANGTPTGFDAERVGGATQSAGTADEIAVTSGRKYYVTFDMVLNSGDGPNYNFYASLLSGPNSDEGAQMSAAGANAFTFTAVDTETDVLAFINFAVGDFEITNLLVRLVLGS